MANPLVPQGTINRLVASIVVNNFAQLNVTPPFLGKDAIKLSFEGVTTTYIPTQTGAVTSPEPYQQVSVSVHLLKTQNLANLYKLQLENDARIGDLTVRPDVLTMTPWYLFNCSIMNVAELNFDGSDAGYRVTLGGIYYINSSLFNQG